VEKDADEDQRQRVILDHIYISMLSQSKLSPRVMTCLEYDNSPIETPLERPKVRLRGVRDRSGVVGTADVSFGIQAASLRHVGIHHM
jgi:hypothetical protein